MAKRSEETSHRRLGRLIEERRLELRIYYIQDAAGKADISRSVWGNVEKGGSAKPATYRKIEDVLGWEHGSCETVINGGSPSDAQAGSAGPTIAEQIRETVDDITARLQRLEQLAAGVEREEEKRRHA